jgi:hypothetical protein
MLLLQLEGEKSEKKSVLVKDPSKGDLKPIPPRNTVRAGVMWNCACACIRDLVVSRAHP